MNLIDDITIILDTVQISQYQNMLSKGNIYAIFKIFIIKVGKPCFFSFQAQINNWLAPDSFMSVSTLFGAYCLTVSGELFGILGIKRVKFTQKYLQKRNIHRKICIELNIEICTEKFPTFVSTLKQT